MSAYQKMTPVLALGITLFMAPLEAAPLGIACIGDSITQSNSTHLSYRHNLWKKLIDQGTDFDLVGSQTANNGGSPAWPSYLGQSFDRDHEGHWGWRTDEILANLPTWLQSYTPDIALIHLGTNDILQGQTLASTISEMDDLIDALRSANPGMTILLARIIPFDPARPTSTLVPGFNDMLADLAIAKTTALSVVAMVDQYTGFDFDDDTFDGIHPDASGEEKMAVKWMAALTPHLTFPPPEITSTTLETAGQLRPYTASLSATSGHPPYNWTTDPGSILPAGLTLSTGGLLSGTPTEAGGFTFDVIITDSHSATAVAPLFLTIHTALESWREEYFETTENFGDAADLTDFDNDGLVNLAEFAFGQDPTESGSAQLPALQLIDGNLVYDFDQPEEVAGILYGAEWNTGLADEWTPVSSSGIAPQQLFTVPTGAEPRIFVRLVVRNP